MGMLPEYEHVHVQYGICRVAGHTTLAMLRLAYTYIMYETIVPRFFAVTKLNEAVQRAKPFVAWKSKTRPIKIILFFSNIVPPNLQRTTVPTQHMCHGKAWGECERVCVQYNVCIYLYEQETGGMLALAIDRTSRRPDAAQASRTLTGIWSLWRHTTKPVKNV